MRGHLTMNCHRSGHESHRNKVQHPSELVSIVDENNQQVGSCTRGQMRAENLIHRSSFVAIFNSQVWQLCTAAIILTQKHQSAYVWLYHISQTCKYFQGQVYVQKRVSFKETYPSYYDPAPGGVVGMHTTAACRAAVRRSSSYCCTATQFSAMQCSCASGVLTPKLHCHPVGVQGQMSLTNRMPSVRLRRKWVLSK